MKIFQILQRRYATLGMSPSQQSPQKYPFNERILFGFLLFALSIPSQIVYIFNMNGGFMDYMECVCTFSASVVICVCFASTILRKTLVFKIIDDMEKLLDMRKTISDFIS